MIQRWQSVLLLIISILFGLEFVFGFATNESNTTQIFSDGLFNVHDHIGLTIITVLGAILSIAAIFLYNNRSLQMKVGYSVILMAIVLPIFAGYVFNSQIPDIANSTHTYEIGTFLPIGVIIVGAIAIKLIKKDDKLVQSMDRLR